MQQKYHWLLSEALQLKGAKVQFKKEWQAYQYLIGGKMFAYLGTNNNNQEIITLKGDPANNVLMIEMYDCVTEGYYANKVHWISIRLDDKNSLSHQAIIDLLQMAYQLVFNNLTKKAQLEICQ